ncbi:hypothetical protein [uncultured Croceicoccus sp.]|uniref:hypothetical protein n=1 Tax=uncultured Croceicoccus sp. TaxID=1295329 RepID=UPI002610371C|nr:hypothetical protein [uncultured Croceicoccus sp.]
MSGIGKSWQVMLADLAMILFLVAASAVPARDIVPAAVALAKPAVAGEPSAVFRDNGEDERFARWLDSRSADTRETLTIRGGPREGRYDAALARAAALVAIAATRGLATRIVLEPESGDAVVAVFAFDRRGAALPEPVMTGSKELAASLNTPLGT